MSFSGYTQEALDFLGDLPTRSPEWFQANRKQYETLLVRPTKAFVVDMGAALQPSYPWDRR